MTKGQALLMIELAKEEGMEASLYEGYSGRGMYGKETTAITVDNRDDGAFLAGLVKANTGKRIPIMVDNLGRGYIVY